MTDEPKKTYWVTGALGDIGGAICEAARAAGHGVFATDIRTGSLGDLPVSTCDVTRERDIEDALGRCLAEHGRLDVLVNSAAVIDRLKINEITDQSWDRTLAVNVRGPFLCSRIASNHWISEKRPGAIVNIGSTGSVVSQPDILAYAVSKGAVRSLTFSLAVALGPSGIRVNLIEPGTIESSLSRERFARPGVRESVEARTPLRRLGIPSEVAPAVLFLGSEGAAYINGSILQIHGGRLVAA